jgi:radical SAM superfamily enzyme YgiQ (UPF0313 family)
MRIALLYKGDNDGFVYPPTFPLMFAKELTKLGYKVELVRDDEDYDYVATPSDSIYKQEYVDLLDFINSHYEFCDEKVKLEDLEVDYEMSPEFDLAGVITAIGCKFKCKFCPQSKMGYTERPLDKIHKEIKWVTNRYEYFEFIDNNVLTNPTRFMSILTFIPEGVKWGALINIDNYEDKYLIRMRDKGCVNLYVGLESFNPLDLEYFGKPFYHKGIDPKEFLAHLRDLGFNVHAFILRGLPNQTKEEFSETIAWLKAHEISYTISRLHVDGEYVKETDHLNKEFLEARMAGDEKLTRTNLQRFIRKYL